MEAASDRAGPAPMGQVARTALFPAALAVIAIPALLWGGALIAQYGFGLPPCEMCYWQRWPHQMALLLGLFALATLAKSTARVLILVGALAIAVSGAIGVFHAGVEYGWWQGLGRCATLEPGGFDMLDPTPAPLIRCDRPAWTLGGVSLAGFNALFSFAGAALVVWLVRRGTRAA